MLLPQVFARAREYFSDLSTDPTVGLSVRILNRNHDGSLFQIRRNSDDVEVIVLADLNDEISLNSLVQNVNEGIGDTLAGNLGEFVASSGFNNPDGLASADDAFVVIWFEQFFGNHASQSTASAQPTIVNAGKVVKRNEKPAIDWYKSGIKLSVSSLTFDSHLDAFLVVNTRDAGYNFTGRFLELASTSSDRNSFFEFAIEELSLFWIASQGDVASLSSASNLLGDKLYSVDYNIPESKISIYGNTNLYASRNDPDSSATITKDLQIGNWIDNDRTFNGVFQEIILYSSNQSANRSNIETDINNYYLIY